MIEVFGRPVPRLSGSRLRCSIVLERIRASAMDRLQLDNRGCRPALLSGANQPQCQVSRVPAIVLAVFPYGVDVDDHRCGFGYRWKFCIRVPWSLVVRRSGCVRPHRKCPVSILLAIPYAFCPWGKLTALVRAEKLTSCCGPASGDARTGVCQISGGSGLACGQLILPSNAMANAWRAGFHLDAHRARPGRPRWHLQRYLFRDR